MWVDQMKLNFLDAKIGAFCIVPILSRGKYCTLLAQQFLNLQLITVKLSIDT